MAHTDESSPSMPSEEWLDLYDAHARPTGETATRKEAHLKGLWHRTVHVYTLRQRQNGWQLLAHLRPAAIRYPNTLDPVFGGHIKAGATPDQTALEEFEEETGIKPAPEKMWRVGETKKDDPVAAPADREINLIYVYVLSPDEEAAFKAAVGEVEAPEWIDLADVRARRDAQPDGWRPSADELNAGLTLVEMALKAIPLTAPV